MYACICRRACICMCVLVEANLRCHSSGAGFAHLVFLDRVFPWSWNSPIRLGWLTNKPSGSFVSASPAHDTTPAFPHEMEGFKPLPTSTYWETRRVLNEPKGGRIQKTTEVKKEVSKTGAGKMAPWVKCLLHQHGNLKAGTAPGTCHPSGGKRRQAVLWSALVSRPS